MNSDYAVLRAVLAMLDASPSYGSLDGPKAFLRSYLKSLADSPEEAKADLLVNGLKEEKDT